jgi:hypothetical protein
MIGKVLISLAFVSSVAAASLELNYETKEIVRLELDNKSGELKEVPFSRVQNSNMRVSFNHDKNKSETHLIQLEKEDRRVIDQPLKGLPSNLELELNVKSQMAQGLRKDVAHLMSGLSAKNQSDYKIYIDELKVLCHKRSELTRLCDVRAKIKGEIQSHKVGDVDGLRRIFADLKKEMVSYDSLTYDIDGYLEFLTTSEILLKNIIAKTSDKKIIETMVIVKEMIVNERIDSYEYTAIRSKSVVNFVNKVLKLI